MKKQRIVIASILKPVDDTRMLDKMGRTLQASGDYEVFIIGYPSQRNPDGGEIKLMPLSSFKRISVTRLIARLKVMLLCIQVKPELLIVNTHELLIVSCLNRIFFGTHIFYDIRENYYRNLSYSNAFPKLLRSPLALWVRMKEKLTAPFFKRFFLAEKGYQKEMSFFRGKEIFVENKSVISGQPSQPSRNKEPGHITLLFTGTLAESTGVFEAIHLAKRLYAITKSIRLRIVGSCMVYETMKKINAEIGGQPFISLIGGTKLVPHDEIVKAIFSADFGIICYPPSPHTENSIPTKLYEYLTYSLPIIIQNNPDWVNLCTPFDACIAIDFKNVDDHYLIEKMHSSKFYTSPATGTTWEPEGKRMLEALAAWSRGHVATPY